MLLKEVVIIIAICSAITILFIVVIISRRCTQPSAPLPTIQPLAHHRSQYLEQLLNSPPTLLNQPTTIPLLSTTPQPSDPPSRHHSPQSHSAGSHTSTKSSRHTPQIEVVLPAPLALISGRASTSMIADNWALTGNDHKY